MTQTGLAVTVPCDNSTVSKVEAGDLAPTERFAVACDEAFPHMAGWFARFYHDCQMWGNGPFPRWFEDWLAAEQQAVTLRIWQPLVVPGLVQTADYARALFLAAQADASEEAMDQFVAARLGRQGIFDKPDRPNVLIVLDESVLHRLIGTPKVTYDQLVQVADMSVRSYISVQVVPAGAGGHAGLDGAFMIAEVEGKSDIMHIDAVEGLTIEKSAQVRNAAVVFDRVRGDALPRGASRDLILRVAEERWNS